MQAIRSFIFLIIMLPASFVNAEIVNAADNSNPGRSANIEIRDNTGRRLIFSGDIAGRLNPKGLTFSGCLNYKDVYGYSSQYDTASAYFDAGAGLNISPAYGQVETHIEWMPWMFLTLRGQYDYYRYFGAYGSLLSFSSSKAPFDENLVDNRNDEESASGQRFLFQPTLQGKIGKIIFRNQMNLAYYTFSGKGPYFLEQEYYTLLKDGDSLINNQTQLLYQAWQGPGKDQIMLAGPFYEVTRARSAGITQKKIGGLLYWVPRPSFHGLDRPRIAIKAGYNLKDPNTKGQAFFALDLGFDLDL
jgi:hypothetical protein